MPSSTNNLQKSTREGIKTLQDSLEWVKANLLYLKNRGEEFAQQGHQLHPDWYEMFKQAPVVIRMPAEDYVVDGIIQHGRMRNLFETGTGRGNKNKRIRVGTEEEILNIPSHTPPHLRPIYGMLDITEPLESAAQSKNHRMKGKIFPVGGTHYGDLILKLKPSVKQRTTFTHGDSMDKSHNFSLLDGANVHLMPHWLMGQIHGFEKMGTKSPIDSMSGGYYDHLIDDADYIEAQIHGGIYPHEDVESLHLHLPSYLIKRIDPQASKGCHECGGTDWEQCDNCSGNEAYFDERVAPAKRMADHFGLPLHLHAIRGDGTKISSVIQPSKPQAKEPEQEVAVAKSEEELEKNIGTLEFPKLGITSVYSQPRATTSPKDTLLTTSLIHKRKPMGYEKGYGFGGVDYNVNFEQGAYPAASSSAASPGMSFGSLGSPKNPQHRYLAYVEGGTSVPDPSTFNATREHEAQHSIFYHLDKKFGPKTRHAIAKQLFDSLAPEHQEALTQLANTQGYTPQYPLFHEEALLQPVSYLMSEEHRKAAPHLHDAIKKAWKEIREKAQMIEAPVNKSEESAKKRKVVASVAVFNPEGKMLWGVRNDTGKHTLPGGHLEEGEKPVKGAIRELFEEAGLKPKDMESLGSEEVDSWDGKSKILVHAFKAICDGKAHSDNDPDEECDKWDWVDVKDGKLPKEILENLHSPKNVTLKLLGLQDWEDMSKSEEDLAKSRGFVTFPKLGAIAPLTSVPIVPLEDVEFRERLMGIPKESVPKRQPLSPFVIPSGFGALSTGRRKGSFVTTGYASTAYPQTGIPFADLARMKTLQGTSLHESQHGVAADIHKRYGVAGRAMAWHLLGPHISDQLKQSNIGKHLFMEAYAETPQGLSPIEELAAKCQNYLNDPSRRAIWNDMVFQNVPSVQRDATHRQAFKQINSIFNTMRAKAKEITPEVLQANINATYKSEDDTVFITRQTSFDLLKSVMEFEELAKMAIADLPVGKLVNQDEDMSFYDYSHLLPEHAKNGEYKMVLDIRPFSIDDQQHVYAVNLYHKNRKIGSVAGGMYGDESAMDIDAEPMVEEYRRKGFGKALYEAAMTHAHKVLGIKNMAQGYHTKAAKRVHESLSRKHGMQYTSTPADVEGKFDYPPYAIKSEELLANLNKFEQAFDALVKSNELVRSSSDPIITDLHRIPAKHLTPEYYRITPKVQASYGAVNRPRSIEGAQFINAPEASVAGGVSPAFDNMEDLNTYINDRYEPYVVQNVLNPSKTTLVAPIPIHSMLTDNGRDFLRINHLHGVSAAFDRRYKVPFYYTIAKHHNEMGHKHPLVAPLIAEYTYHPEENQHSLRITDGNGRSVSARTAGTTHMLSYVEMKPEHVAPFLRMINKTTNDPEATIRKVVGAPELPEVIKASDAPEIAAKMTKSEQEIVIKKLDSFDKLLSLI